MHFRHFVSHYFIITLEITSARKENSLKAETQSSRTAQGGCGYLFKYM